MDFRFTIGQLTKVNRPENDISTGDVTLFNKDEIKNIPFMLPLGSNEKRFGYTMIEAGIEVILIKHDGSDWLIIGEVSVKETPSNESRNDAVLQNVVDALDCIADAFDSTMDIVLDIADTQKQISYGLMSAGAGLLRTSTSTAGVHPTPLSNASGIASSATATSGYGARVLVQANKLVASANKHKGKFPPCIKDYAKSQRDLYVVEDEA